MDCQKKIAEKIVEKKADYYLCTNLKWIVEKDEWKNLCGIGMVRSNRLTKDGESTELRYFITSLTDVNLAAKAMRSHWSIENNLHWVLDTVFDEDYCRVRKDNSAHNLNIIRKLVMKLLKGLDLPVATKKKNLTIGNKQTLCLKNENVCFTLCRIYNAFALGIGPVRFNLVFKYSRICCFLE